MVKWGITALSLGLILSGCVTAPDETPKSDSATTDSAGTDRLSARELKKGECSLFVFAVDADPRLILFSDNIADYGVWASGQGEAQLTVTETSGDPALGQYPLQKFQTPGGQNLSLDLIIGGEMERGVQFPSGTLKITDPEGWEKVMPVSAWAACQTGAS